MYALVEFQGKQFKAEEGKKIKTPLLSAEPGAEVKMDKVLLLSGDTVKVGKPYVEGASVVGTVETHSRDKKVIVFKYIPKKDYRRTKGHRQDYSVVKITKVASL